VFCDSDGEPRLPRLILLDVSSPHFVSRDTIRRNGDGQDYVTGGALPFASFDFVISFLALNGPSKVTHHSYLPNAVDLVAPGGLAVLHVGDAMFDDKTTTAIGEHALVYAFTLSPDERGREVSIAWLIKLSPYPLHGLRFYFVVLMIRV
jgi:hypothetical protein